MSSSRAELSAHGKNVFVTGAGTGVGAWTVLSFVEAGATNIGVFARRTSKLKANRGEVPAKYADVVIHAFADDVSDQAGVEKANSG